MKNLIKIIFFCGILIITSFSCEEEDKEAPEEKMFGKWKEESPCHDGTCDTIIFKEDMTIGLYFPFINWSYSLIQTDSIYFFDNLGSSYTFKYQFIENDRLIIFNFIDKSISQEITDITFARI